MSYRHFSGEKIFVVFVDDSFSLFSHCNFVSESHCFRKNLSCNLEAFGCGGSPYPLCLLRFFKNGL